jgi:hypothetical protein
MCKCVFLGHNTIINLTPYSFIHRRKRNSQKDEASGAESQSPQPQYEMASIPGATCTESAALGIDPESVDPYSIPACRSMGVPGHDSYCPVQITPNNPYSVIQCNKKSSVVRKLHSDPDDLVLRDNPTYEEYGTDVGLTTTGHMQMYNYNPKSNAEQDNLELHDNPMYCVRQAGGSDVVGTANLDPEMCDPDELIIHENSMYG